MIWFENFKQWVSASHPEVTGHFQRQYNSCPLNGQRMPVSKEDGKQLSAIKLSNSLCNVSLSDNKFINFKWDHLRGWHKPHWKQQDFSSGLSGHIRSGLCPWGIWCSQLLSTQYFSGFATLKQEHMRAVSGSALRGQLSLSCCRICKNYYFYHITSKNPPCLPFN